MTPYGPLFAVRDRVRLQDAPWLGIGTIQRLEQAPGEPECCWVFWDARDGERSHPPRITADRLGAYPHGALMLDDPTRLFLRPQFPQEPTT